MITLDELKYHIPFFVILIGVIAFWLSIKLDKDASTTVSIPIDYKVPHGFLLDETSPSSVSVNVSGKVDSILDAGSSQAIQVALKPRGKQKIVAEDLRKAIQEILPENINITSIPISSLEINLFTALTKKVPISPENIEVSLQKFYNQISPIRFSPDSVELSGPREVINAVESWPTVEKSFLNLSEDLTDVSIALSSPEDNSISMDTSKTKISISVDRLIEDKVICEIPEINDNFITLPSHVEIKYSYAKRRVNKANCNDFNIELLKIDTSDTKYKIDVKSSGNLVNILNFYPPYVELLKDQD